MAVRFSSWRFDRVEEMRPLGCNCTQSHALCMRVMYCNMCKARAPPTTCWEAIYEPRKCLSLWRNPTVHITKNKSAVCFWEDFPGLTSHFKPEGPQHRGESVRELSTAETTETTIRQCFIGEADLQLQLLEPEKKVVQLLKSVGF